MAGVALGDIDLKTAFLIGVLFWWWPRFQSIAPVSKSDVCLVGDGLMICSILCSNVRSKMAVFQSDALDCVLKRACYHRMMS